MPVAINFKICDNASDCSGRAACPVGAISWDDNRKTLEINNDKCISCGKCEKACQVNAIRVAKTEEELRQIIAEFDKDPRKQSDLLVDRYGAMPLRDDYLTKSENFKQEIESYPRLLVLEVFKDETIECLLKSIPIKELLSSEITRFRKMKIEDNQGEDILKKYQIVQLPALLIFKEGKLIGKVEGYYPENQKVELVQIIQNFL